MGNLASGESRRPCISYWGSECKAETREPPQCGEISSHRLPATSMDTSAISPRFLAVDFYCGAGGTTRGLLDAGGYVICGIDKDESNRVTYQRNNRNDTLDQGESRFLGFDMFPNSEDYWQGQQHKVWEELRTLIPSYRNLAPGAPLMFVICAPCQSFTRFIERRMTVQRAQGRDRDLNLLTQTIDFIAEFKPEMVISENVTSIKTGPYKHIWSHFQNRLRSLGYAVGEGSVCASRFGVPQFRRRSVLLAIRNRDSHERALDPPVPNCDPDASTVSVMEAIGQLPPLQAGGRSNDVANHVCRNLSELNRRRLMSVKPGEPNWGLSETPFGDLSLACHRRLAAKGKRGFGDVYTRMDPCRPSPTLTTRFHSISNGRFGHFDEYQVRALSLREGARLQTFRDDYEFYEEGMDAIARMIGNAVPPKLSTFMAKWILNYWRDCGDRSRE